ncbi:sulfotransferase domain-containing protein [Flavilitoribacter nigricans]|uniref:Sulfotransferase domain-containing protein n=1 Tax=Flavilitoribacter nigricans (strain ATCC 23147 / DSM 23189 / NBRC 102662 / NCIMB 1420 / SS-2) TaxID=1122177 RepID=A0A2D0ND54_FLAN2|nr:sulfotransferase domain-containing protein [Flavilitoribacter nigricans]PHN06444.1 hypothetical protein CRP01_12820 [Flavilitoribacter nigricans DSM 23189 = NBRC 102662]
MKKLFLHIGYGKCGTTAIQKFAYNNFKHNSRIYLPETGWWKQGEGHHHLAANLNYEVREEDLSEKWEMAANELVDSGAEIGFISSEQFCFLRPAQVKVIHRVLTRYDWEIKIIFFVRSQLDLALSSYMQKLKHTSFRELGSFEKFFSLHKNSFDFQHRIAVWEELFGLENLIVRLYDKALVENVIDQLNEILEVDIEPAPVAEPASPRANFSIIPECIELIKFYDENTPDSSAKRPEFISKLITLSQKMARCSAGIKLFAKEELQIIDHFRGINEDFGNKFLSESERRALNQKFTR